MNKYIFCFIAISAFNFSFAQSKYTIAVLDLQPNGISDTEAATLSEELRTVLVLNKTFTVIDRSNMQEILQEQGFQLSGCTTQECAVEAGKLLGVQKMVSGSVGKIGKIFTINLNLINVETGEIEDSFSKRHKGSIEGLLDLMKISGDELSGIQFKSKSLDNIKIDDTKNDTTKELMNSKHMDKFNRFSVRIHSGYNLPVGDFKNMWQGVISDDIESFSKGGFIWGSSVDYYFLPDIGVSLNINYTKWTASSGSFHSIIPITFSIRYNILSNKFPFSLHALAGVGKYFTKSEFSVSNNKLIFKDDVWGIFGGFQFNYNLTKKYGFYSEYKYNMVYYSKGNPNGTLTSFDINIGAFLNFGN